LHALIRGEIGVFFRGEVGVSFCRLDHWLYICHVIRLGGMGTYPVLIELLSSYEHFKSGVFISHPGGEGSIGTQKNRRRGTTRVVKGGT
jgi:hypothetical protein